MDYESKSTNREKGRGRGRGRKKVAENENKPQQITITADECNELEAVTLDMDADITQLEAPTFSTINKGPPEPMLRLNWDHKTHLIGEKMISPMIHCCDKCEAPILIYGRMIPCKHVFCLTCAEQETKVCPRCQEKIVRIERSGLGTVFMCTFGGSRYGNTGCRRTYLSQRDLQAHINHRHVSGTFQSKENITFSPTIPSMKTSLSSTARSKTASIFHHTVAGDPRVQSNSSNDYFHKLHSPSAHSMPTSQHQSSRQQSHHHSLLSSHHPSKPSQSFPLHQHMNRSSQHHLSMPIAQQVMQQTDFGSPLMMSNYPQPSTHAGGVTSSSNVRSNLITVQIHDSNVDSIGIPIASGFPRPNFSSQFSQAPSSNMPFSRSSAWSIT